MAKGAAWMVAFKFAQRGLGLLSTIILARLLLPDDFGVIAMALTIFALLQLLSAFGFDMAIIQRAEVTRAHLDTAWTFTFALGCVTALLLLALARPTADFYGDPRLEGVIYLLALGAVFEGCQNIGIVAFRKDLEFHKEFWFLTGKKAASFLVAIPLAIWLRNYWALVIGMVSGQLLMTLVSYYVHPYRPRLALSAARDLLAFSSWLLVNNFCHFLTERLSHFIIGKVSGSSALGLYSMSFDLSTAPTAELMAPINRAVFPGYAKLAVDKEALKRAYLDVISPITLFAFPAGVGIAAIADPLVRVVLGPNWLETIPMIELFGLFGALAALTSNLSSVYLALGRPAILTSLMVLRLAFLIPALFILTQAHGPIGAAWATLAVALGYTPLAFAVALKILALPPGALIGAIWRPLAASLGMFYCVRLALSSLNGAGTLEEAAALLAGLGVGLVSYGLIIWLLWRLSGAPKAGETMALNWISQRLRLRRRQAS